jgi:hypothetical protein
MEGFEATMVQVYKALYTVHSNGVISPCFSILGSLLDWYISCGWNALNFTFVTKYPPDGFVILIVYFLFPKLIPEIRRPVLTACLYRKPSLCCSMLLGTLPPLQLL